MRTATGTFATACALSAALLVAGCGGDGGDKATRSSGEVFLQPAAAQGPDPFTDSTALPSPAVRTPQPDPSTPTGATQPVRSVSGSTPGLYAGTARVGSCDVDRQIGKLTSDQAKVRAFAQVEGVSQASVADYLRGLAPVVLRADTRVTNHGFRAGRATGYQSVLQAGTAVLVDNRGVPRVRCACGNPLKPPVATQGGQGTNGRPWSGYRPDQVIVVTPAPQVITGITIIDVVGNTWIERPVGHDVHHDHVVPPPASATTTPRPTRTPSPDGNESGTAPSRSADSASPGDESSSPSDPATDCETPTVTVTPGATRDVPTGKPSAGPTDCATATVTAVPPTTKPETSPDATDGIGPETVPNTPDVPDGGGLVPDNDTTSVIFDSPTNVFDS
ncbi:hypothetical protein OHB14_16570 [Streptomyces sp. NBC_01613]|uniref:DUF6777 domain-containing protein n=1 Tax=Streptomyces sp. NBC_01613 TaxID=2975896 RepID=UPI00386851B4